MPRPRNEIDQYREDIIKWHLSGIGIVHIRERLRTNHGIKVNSRTINRRIKDWELPPQRQAAVLEDPELMKEIESCIFRIGLSETQTLQVLRAKGWEIAAWQLKRIRLDPDRRWLRRVNDPEDRVARLEAVEEAMLEMRKQSNALAGYRRTLLQSYFRQ